MEGWGSWESPSVFQIARKRRRTAPPFLVHLIMHLFRICGEDFRPRSRKVRPPLPGYVKWPHIRKSLNVRQSYTDWTIVYSFSDNTRNSVYKMNISEFWYQWPKVRSICDHYKSMEKNEKHLPLTKTILYTLKHRITEIIDILNRKIASNEPPHDPKVTSGHERSPAGFRQ